MGGGGKIKILNILKKGAGLMAMAGGMPGVGVALLRGGAGADSGAEPPQSPAPAQPFNAQAELIEDEDFKNRERASTGVL